MRGQAHLFDFTQVNVSGSGSVFLTAGQTRAQGRALAAVHAITSICAITEYQQQIKPRDT
jgi:hypothetical protein